MPKTDKYAAARIMIRNIQYLADSDGITEGELARAMHKSRSTWDNRKKTPRLMTVGDLILLADRLGVRPGQLLEKLSPADIPPVFEEEGEGGETA